MARLRRQINLGSYVREDRQNAPGLKAQVYLILLFDGITPYRSVVDGIYWISTGYLLDIYWTESETITLLTIAIIFLW